MRAVLVRSIVASAFGVLDGLESLSLRLGRSGGYDLTQTVLGWLLPQ
jgi:hypothetical protein